MSYQVVNDILLYPEVLSTKTRDIVLDTYKNLEWLLSHFKAEIRYNLMTRRREILIPDHYKFDDDFENDILARIEYIATINHFKSKQIDKFLDLLAGENPYHPIVECIKNKPWDQVPRLDSFLETIHCNNPETDYEIVKTWMVAAIAAAHSSTGFTNHGALVFQGEQGIGKTAWVNRLDPMNCGAVKTGVLLDPKNKDSVIGINRCWIAELGELDATLNKTDIAHLKSYVTSPCDYVRLPYARKESYFARRTAYIATVNEDNFLVDNTGNRRWWTIPVTKINYEHTFDMQQVWAEVFAIWKFGFPTYLTPELQKYINGQNKSHEKIDPLKEKLLSDYDWETPTRRELTSTQILEELGYPKPKQSECTRMGHILTELNGSKSRKVDGQRFHKIPQLLSKTFFKNY